MDSFLSNIFPWMGHQQKLARAAAQASTLEAESHQIAPIIPLSMTVDTSTEMDMSDCMVDTHETSPEMTGASRKRNRRLSTPSLISSNGNTVLITTSAVVSPCHSDSDDDSTLPRPKKIFRGAKHYKLFIVTADGPGVPKPSNAVSSKFVRPVSPFSPVNVREDARRVKILSETPLDLLPEDIVAHALSFVSDVSDRYALQCTSKQFQRISSAPMMMNQVNVGGDPETGKNGIILETDTKETATDRLTPFAASGNLEAIYMLGIIKSYCDCDVEDGIDLLKMASSRGFVRASYALGVVLRDTAPKDAYYYMSYAADQKYLPALQELLPADDMKAKYGEPSADELRSHLDHLCLNRLLSRNYLLSSNLRSVNTSHCWNNLCGRWAYKATTTTSRNNNPSNEAIRNTPGTALHHRRSTRNVSRNSTNTSGVLSASSSSSQASTGSESQKNRVSRMKMCSRCCRAKYCSKLCQIYDWRSGRHKMECQFL